MLDPTLVTKNMARLVALRYNKEEDIDYDGYASIARLKAM